MIELKKDKPFLPKVLLKEGLIMNSSSCPLDRETLLKILDHSYDEIFVTDKDGVTIYVNPACQRNYGVVPEGLIGQTAGQMALERYCFPPITPIILQEKQRVTLEQETITGRRIVTTAEPVFSENGDLELIIMNVRDIYQINEVKHDIAQTLELVDKYKEEVELLRRKEFINHNLVARDKAMLDLLELVQRIAPVESNVLILGESGTGKGVIAKHIHKLSSRKDGPFITINCAAIPDQLLESELFGYASGTFTGADKKGKIGLIELATGGSLFLDEIAEIPLGLQAKILHVIQEYKYSPVGGRESKSVDCRIIAATNSDLNEAVKAGKFRADLYYRLNVIELEIPPLRKRLGDILPLIYFFLNKYDKKYKTAHQFTQDCLDVLLQHQWPGNIRELEHLVERLVITTPEDIIKLMDLPKSLRNDLHGVDTGLNIRDFSLAGALKEVEKNLVIDAYKQYKTTYKVAESLQVSQSTAWRLITKYVHELP
ncbi:MAG: sigma 54-interacting transcriptional regulator [Desulfosporosinus sp.]|nr:sigma 54-interacting transcriptional regulator [Desulfosporosinus sp.]